MPITEHQEHQERQERQTRRDIWANEVASDLGYDVRHGDTNVSPEILRGLRRVHAVLTSLVSDPTLTSLWYFAQTDACLGAVQGMLGTHAPIAHAHATRGDIPSTCVAIIDHMQGHPAPTEHIIEVFADVLLENWLRITCVVYYYTT